MNGRYSIRALSTDSGAYAATAADMRCIAPLLAAGIIAGIGSLAGAGIHAASNSVPRKVRIANQIANHQFDLNKQAWEMQNAYDHPAQQMQRFAEAGLNPNLVYGQMGGSSATLSAPELPNNSEMSESRAGDVASALTNTIMQYYNLKSIESGIASQQANTNYATARTASQYMKNAFDAQANQYRLESIISKTNQEKFKESFQMVADYNKTKAAIDKMIQETKTSQATEKEKTERTLNLIKQRDLIDGQIKALYQQMEKVTQDMTFSAELHPFVKANMSAAYREAMTRGDLLEAQVLTEGTRRNGIALDNVLKRKDLEYYASDKDFKRWLETTKTIHNASGLFGLGSVLQSAKRERSYKKYFGKKWE